MVRGTMNNVTHHEIIKLLLQEIIACTFWFTVHASLFLVSPQRFYKGGSGPAEILLNLIAVTILANPKTLDVAKKTKIICIRRQSFNK